MKFIVWIRCRVLQEHQNEHWEYIRDGSCIQQSRCTRPGCGVTEHRKVHGEWGEDEEASGVGMYPTTHECNRCHEIETVREGYWNA
jgi:hypothetical protein